VPEPLSHEHILAFSLANETAETLRALLERAADVAPLEPEGACGWEKSDLGVYWQVFKYPSGWFEPLSGTAELVAWESDVWARERIDQPAFGAGFTVPAKRCAVARDAVQRGSVGNSS